MPFWIGVDEQGPLNGVRPLLELQHVRCCFGLAEMQRDDGQPSLGCPVFGVMGREDGTGKSLQ